MVVFLKKEALGFLGFFDYFLVIFFYFTSILSMNKDIDMQSSANASYGVY